jgi:hypothetical protein
MASEKSASEFSSVSAAPPQQWQMSFAAYRSARYVSSAGR